MKDGGDKGGFVVKASNLFVLCITHLQLPYRIAKACKIARPIAGGHHQAVRKV